jgi:hypothetical protein
MASAKIHPMAVWQVAQELCKEEEQDGVDRAAIHRCFVLLRSPNWADSAPSKMCTVPFVIVETVVGKFSLYCVQEAARRLDQHRFRPEGDRARCGNSSARHRRAGGTYLEFLWPGGIFSPSVVY